MVLLCMCVNHDQDSVAQLLMSAFVVDLLPSDHFSQAPHQQDPTTVTAAWDALRTACLSVESWPASNSEQESTQGGNDNSHCDSSSAAEKNGSSLEKGGEAAGGDTAHRRGRACVSMARLPASGGQLALDWLHQVRLLLRLQQGRAKKRLYDLLLLCSQTLIKQTTHTHTHPGAAPSLPKVSGSPPAAEPCHTQLRHSR